MLIAPHKTPTKRSAINGIGLIEVLVALVILAVGMLGIASLYVTTLQAKITAQSRMQAINLADDMADRIRANRLVSTPTIYQVAKTSAVLSSPGKICAINSATALGSVCTADEMATYDLYQWSQEVFTVLPGSAALEVSVTTATATTPPFYTITLKWTEPFSGNSAGAVLSHSLQVQIGNTVDHS